MTAAFLQTELITLFADSKKRSTDVRTAAEKSLTDLKAITVTSETQLAADLARRPNFVDPFVLACQSRNPKLANSATACLQRLVASKAVALERLEDVLNGYRDVLSTSYDVQLKILQTLPAILQLYASEVRGQLLARTLEICATLEASKTNLVSSSARATFEQLVESVFERARMENESSPGHERKPSNNSVSTSASDAGRIFEDLCSLLNGSEPTFLQANVSSSLFLLEVLEKIIDGNAGYVKSTPSLIEACRAQLLPGLMSLLHGKEDFHQHAQVLRLSLVLLQKLPAQLLLDMKDLLSTVLVYLDRDHGPLWKRVLEMEFYRQLCSNFGLMLRIFDTYGTDEDNVVTSLMAVFVRIAAEDPALIGLGRQSTVPVRKGSDTREDEMASIEVQGIGGGLASVSSADAGVTGISLDFSALGRRLMDDENYGTIPTIPKTYLYALILECMSSFCEGLSKFIMPLSVSNKHSEDGDVTTEDEGEDRPTEKKPHRAIPHKYQRLANPLKMSSLPQHPQVQASSTMIDNCWPAILATCSTFLNAALDSHFYHGLIRSMQKLAQVSGTLGLGTPRDALLTSLAKGSVPPNATAIIMMSQSFADNDDDEAKANGVRSPVMEIPRSPGPRQQTLNVRHLLCLRALLNLGIALGPTLAQESWFIVIETLQLVETLMSIAGVSIGTQSLGSTRTDTGSESQTTLAGEMSAVNAASKRLFESTKSYSDDSFAAIAQALLRMVGETHHDPPARPKDDIIMSPTTMDSPSMQLPKRNHQASRSISGLWTKTKALDIEVAFVLSRTKELTRVNLHRFTSTSSVACTWGLIMPCLMKIAKSVDIKQPLRLQAASIADLIAVEVVKGLDPAHLTEDEIDQLQCKCLEVLLDQVNCHDPATEPSPESVGLHAELQKRAFEALENILGQSGDSFHKRPWGLIFATLNFGVRPPAYISNGGIHPTSQVADMNSVTPVAFRCIELICNDFLQQLGPDSLNRLILILYRFGGQQHDLNMSLTTTSLLRNICVLLQGRAEVIKIIKEDFEATQSEEIANYPPDRLVDRLWVSSLDQLKQLCKDERSEVRDASLRILVQVLEDVGDQLDPSSWAVCLDECFFATIRFHGQTLQSFTDDARRSSLGKALEGTTNLIAEYLDHLSNATSFDHTWSQLLTSFDQILGNQNVSLQGLVFECLARLLKALKDVRLDSARHIASVLDLWAQHTPMEEVTVDAGPNQDLLAAHARLFVQAHSTNAKASATFFKDGSSAEHVMQSLRWALLNAKHSAYSNDTRKRAVEQEAVFEALQALRLIMESTPERYVSYLLELIQAMRPQAQDIGSPQPPPTSTTKGLRKPTYIAMLSGCVELLGGIAGNEQNGQKAWNESQLQLSLRIMSQLIDTKYTSVPVNPDAPLWQHATATAVKILEAARTNAIQLITNNPSDGSVDLNGSIILCLSSILSSGGLETRIPVPDTAPIIINDESSDISHFRRFHRAATPLLSANSIAQERRAYILTLFKASLVARPWIFDFPADDTLLTNPLSLLTATRNGSIHRPSFPQRSRIPYSALNALFSLVEVADPHHSHTADVDNDDDNDAVNSTPLDKPIAIAAAPYILLRIAHPIKLFLADQPLRGLTPLPMEMQEELKWLLERCLSLRANESVFAEALHQPQQSQAASSSAESIADIQRRISGDDGKPHLKMLFHLILKFHKGWRATMRLPDGMGWQDDVVGKDIEQAMERWVESVGQGWSFG